MPRDREGKFHTQLFDRSSRYEEQVAEGLTQMFVAGTSTRHPWEKWLPPSWASRRVEVASVGSITRSPNSLKRGVAALCKLDFRMLSLDGIYLEVRHGDQVDPTIL